MTLRPDVIVLDTDPTVDEMHTKCAKSTEVGEGAGPPLDCATCSIGFTYCFWNTCTGLSCRKQCTVTYIFSILTGVILYILQDRLTKLRN